MGKFTHFLPGKFWVNANWTRNQGAGKFLRGQFCGQKWPSKALFGLSNAIFIIEFQYISLYISLVRPLTSPAENSSVEHKIEETIECDNLPMKSVDRFFLLIIAVLLCSMVLMASEARTEENPSPAHKDAEKPAEESSAPAHKDSDEPAEQVSDLEKDPEPGARKWAYGVYLDLGYTINFNNPGNGLWRSKSTTFEVDDPRVNMALAYLHKEATPQSRWGIEFALQTGVETDGLIPEPPPEPIKNAELWSHFNRANASYLFPVGNELRLMGGLINSYIAYESYFALGNVNYTRGYITDNVPYFFFGLEGLYPLKEDLKLSLNLVSGWNYLTNPNDLPSLGVQVNWQVSSRTKFKQNFYYGPDQEDTDLEFWRFFSDSILEWKKDPFLVAASFDIGTEKQAEQVGNPRYYWMAAALWSAWRIIDPLTLAFRPEFFYDPDGLITGARQTLQAYTLTLKYQFAPASSHTLAAVIEYRYDRSTGPDSGFYKGEDNRLVPNQHLLIFALMWHFGKR